MSGKTLKLTIIALLALMVTVSALPRYTTGWPWSQPFKVPHQSELQAIRDEGITIPGWQTKAQIRTKFGGADWSIQELTTSDESRPVFLLLRPQIWEGDQPEVEWLDIRSAQNWDIDNYRELLIEIPAPSQDTTAESSQSVRIKGGFFRASNNERESYAVLHWYAWPTGGSPAPARWFWADQRAQWQWRQRMPWVAVNIWVPIQPLGDIDVEAAFVEQLAQSVHQTLIQTVFD